MNPNSKLFSFYLSVLFVIALTAVYWNHFDNGFHFDDSHTIVNNTYIKDIRNLPLFFVEGNTSSSLPTNRDYGPVVTSLNAIDYYLAGSLNPVFFHWHIYLEFLLLLGLFYRLLLHIFEQANGKSNYLLAVIGAAFFGFHTATAETINYIISRSDGFSTLMVLVSALMYINGKGWKKQLALIPFIIGCLAKPTTLMLAPILLLYEMLFISPALFVRDEKARMVPKITAALKGTLSFFLSGVIMYFFTRSMYSDTWTPGGSDSLAYLNTQFYIFWVYIKTFFYPAHLSADTDLTLIKDYFSARVLLGMGVVVLSLVIAFRAALSRHTLPITFGILWFYVALIPTSSVIPLAEVMNHHRTFFPYMGLVMAVVWTGQLIFDRLTGGTPSTWSKGLLVLMLCVIFSLHGYGTYLRNEIWDNDASLWKDVTQKSPKNGRGLMNFGLAEMGAGKIESAISYFEKALNTDYGRHPYLFINLGIAKNSLGVQTKNASLVKEGEMYLKKAIETGPGYPSSHYYYAEWLNKNGRQDEAIKHLNLALELSPAHEWAKELLAQLTMTASARLQELEKQAILQDTPEVYLQLSLAYYNLGQYENCLKASRRALILKPGYAEAYNNICSAYNKLGLYEEAISACNKALELKPGFPLAQGNLNWAIKSLENVH